MLHFTPRGRSSTLIRPPARTRIGVPRCPPPGPYVNPGPASGARGAKPAAATPSIDTPRGGPLRSTRRGRYCLAAHRQRSIRDQRAGPLSDDRHRFRAGRLRSMARRVFLAAGTPRHIADVVAEILVNADLTGYDSHGVMRIPEYLRAIEDGTLDPAAEPTVLR